MKSTSKRSLLWAALAAGFLLRPNVDAFAVEHLIAIQGEVTSVDDNLNWFNNSIQLGMTVNGTYNFFDTGYLRSDDPPSSFYRYFFQPNMFGAPIMPAKMHIALGGHEYDTGPGVFFYGIEVINDSNGLGFLPAGDGYRVQSPLPFPAHFSDLAFDPVVDPDGNFVPILGMALRFEDSTGTAWSSTDLPTAPPSLAAFSSAVGTVFIADGNGEPNYATAEFRITSVQAIPEPTTLAMCVMALAASAMLPKATRATKHKLRDGIQH
jgi:hypothetical protein